MMAECSANPDQINPQNCSCEVQQKHPSHSQFPSTDEHTVDKEFCEAAVTKSGKYLPNGKVRLLVDDNGW